MPVINDMVRDIDFEELTKSLPFLKSERFKSFAKEIVRDLVLQIEEKNLLKPLASYETFRITGISDDKISIEGGETITGSLPSSFFKSARELVFLLFTLGNEFEELGEFYSRNKEISKSLLIEEIGSYLLHNLSLKVFGKIKKDIETKGLFISNPLAPGFSGFPTEEQEKIYKLANGKDIEMRLTTGFMLYPRNSLSMVMGVSDNPFSGTERSFCYYCDSYEKCQYNHRFSV